MLGFERIKESLKLNAYMLYKCLTKLVAVNGYWPCGGESSGY